MPFSPTLCNAYVRKQLMFEVLEIAVQQEEGKFFIIYDQTCLRVLRTWQAKKVDLKRNKD